MPLISFANYDLTLIAPPRPMQIGGSQEGPLDIATMMPPPFRIYEVPDGSEIANLQQRLTIALTPPRIVIADHSGESQPQAQMISAARALIDALASSRTQIESYGWNADFSITGLGRDHLLEELFSELRVHDLLVTDRTGPWAADRIELSAPADFSDKIRLVLHPERQSDSPGIRILVNAHFDSTPDSADIELQAQEFAKLSQEGLGIIMRDWDEGRS